MEAAALRKRGSQLERLAQQLRLASRSATTPKPSITEGQQHTARQIASLPLQQQGELHFSLQQGDASLPAAQEAAAQQLAMAATAAAAQQDQAVVAQDGQSLPAGAAAAQQGQNSHAEASAQLDVAQEAVAQPQAAAQGDFCQGLVVWGTFKGWPAWPGLVTTEEEMDVAEVKSKKGQLLKGMHGIHMLHILYSRQGVCPTK